MAIERHKPGPLKQQNKTHKHGRHKSKGAMDKQNKGKVSIKTLSKKGRGHGVGKVNRRNQAKQVRSKKRDEILEQKRKIGKQGSPPHIIAVIPLTSNADSQAALSLFTSCDDECTVFPSSHSTTIVSPQLKQRFTILPLQYGDLYSILDAIKVADTVIFLTSAENPVDSFTDQCLTAIFAQGLPASFHGIQGLDKCPTKKRNEVKKGITKMIEKRFPKDKVHSLDTSQDALVALRLIANQHLRSIHFRDSRPHLLAQSVSFEPNSADNSKGTVKVTGFLRGKVLSANRLVHLSGFGDFQMKQIDAVNDPFSANIKRKTSKGSESMMTMGDDDSGAIAMDEDIKVVDKANPAFQESLQSEVEPDPMEGEQTWPTEEELNDAEEMRKTESRKNTKKVPKGTSDYQASWITDGGQEDDDDEDDDDDDDDDSDDSGDDEFIRDIREPDDDDESMKMENEEEFESVSVSGTEPDQTRYDDELDLDEERVHLEKLRSERENEMFPDEIDTPMDVPARIRFQKYRGLKSFRTSSWDPKENLPSDYARIFQFQNFNRTRKRVMVEDEPDGALEGWYITVHIIDVPKAFMDCYDTTKPLVVFGLLPHEQKLSVVHFVVKRLPTFTDPIKSKERVVFHCGYRRFTACPIYSEHTTGDKHKYERFFPKEGVCVVSVYAPIMFPPCPVLMFTFDSQTGSQSLAATGSLYKVDPDRIIAKKIVLSGHPYKINKRSAVIRYMFFNREDISWFKPVELFTKHGRRGHIKEPLGTHGHMKCVLDGTLKAQDTICMNLYKRVFPKWSYESTVPTPTVQLTQQPVAMDT